MNYGHRVNALRPEVKTRVTPLGVLLHRIREKAAPYDRTHELGEAQRKCWQSILDGDRGAQHQLPLLLTDYSRDDELAKLPKINATPYAPLRDSFRQARVALTNSLECVTAGFDTEALPREVYEWLARVDAPYWPQLLTETVVSLKFALARSTVPQSDVNRLRHRITAIAATLGYAGRCMPERLLDGFDEVLAARPVARLRPAPVRVGFRGPRLPTLHMQPDGTLTPPPGFATYLPVDLSPSGCE